MLVFRSPSGGGEGVGDTVSLVHQDYLKDKLNHEAHSCHNNKHPGKAWWITLIWISSKAGPFPFSSPDIYVMNLRNSSLRTICKSGVKDTAGQLDVTHTHWESEEVVVLEDSGASLWEVCPLQGQTSIMCTVLHYCSHGASFGFQ